MTLRVSILLLLLSLPVAAAAQDERGASAGGSVSATNMESRNSWSFAGSFEYRFNRVAGLEIEATAVPTLKSDFPGATIQTSSSSFTELQSALGAIFSSIAIFPGPRFENPRGRAVIFTNNARIHIPTTAARLDPYFVAGGGVANVRHTADLVFTRLTPPPGIVIPTLPSQPITSSSVDLALTIGGGVSVRAASGLWIEGDLRLFRLLGDEDRNVGRFGVGARYRF